MVTPENGMVILRGLRTGREYAYNIYSSDVVGAAVTWSTNGIAGTGSQTFILIPEDCILKDVSIATGQTVSTNWIIQVNDVPTGSIVSIANAINTLQTRSIPNIPIAGGKKLTFVQA